MRRKYWSGFIFLFLLTIITGCSGGNSGETGNDIAKAKEEKEKITLKFAVSQPNTHVIVTETLNPFMERVNELTDGQVDFEFYPAEQIGKLSDLLELTNDGVTDISFVMSIYHSSQMPIINALQQIPGLYSSSYDGSMAFHELSKKTPILETDFLSNGVRPILTYAPLSAELWTKGQEIKVPEDLKGLKVRVGGELANKTVSALSASPLNIPVSEMYEGLERGVYDVSSINNSSIKDYGLDELVKFGTSGVGFYGAATGVVINEKVFQELPENVQEAIVQAGDEFTESNAKFYDDYAEKAVQEFKDNGVNVYELTEDEKAQWHKFYNEMENSWIKEQSNPDIKKTLDAFREAIKKYN